MGLEEVKKEIIGKAGKEAEALLGQGKKEAQEMMKKTAEEIENYRKSAEEDAKKLAERMEKKAMAAAEFDARKMKLDRKKEMIDRVFENVAKDLAARGAKEREADIKKLLAKARKEIEVKYLHANSGDRDAVKRISGVEYAETEIIGGIVAESPGLDFSVDLSYDSILEEIRKRHLQEIAGILFG